MPVELRALFVIINLYASAQYEKKGNIAIMRLPTA